MAFLLPDVFWLRQRIASAEQAGKGAGEAQTSIECRQREGRFKAARPRARVPWSNGFRPALRPQISTMHLPVATIRRCFPDLAGRRNESAELRALFIAP